MQTQLWLANGVVERLERNLPWTNNTVHVLKSNGSVRVCVDCTPANNVTADFDWPLPRLQDLRCFLKGKRWFARMDLADAFFRIKVPRLWRRLTSFTCDGRDYQFIRMPFGLKTAPSVFQRFMDHTMASHRDDAFWYMDDILVAAETLPELRRKVRAIQDTLRRAGCKINHDKSEYDKQGLLFAGLWVYHKGVGPNHAKVEKLLSLAAPRTKEERQSALGLASYLRDHIPLASKLTAHLNVRKGEKQSEATFAEEWGHLKREVASTITTLQEWDDDADADLYTDASKVACGAVLIQKGKIVALASRKLLPAETRWHTTDRECLGLVLGAKKFRMFLHRSGGVTRVHSDHTALLSRRPEDLTPRQARMKMTLDTWIPAIRYVQGKKNPADYISRWSLGVFGGQIQA